MRPWQFSSNFSLIFPICPYMPLFSLLPPYSPYMSLYAPILLYSFSIGLLFYFYAALKGKYKES